MPLEKFWLVAGFIGLTRQWRSSKARKYQLLPATNRTALVKHTLIDKATFGCRIFKHTR